jgi:inner membrane protein
MNELFSSDPHWWWWGLTILFLVIEAFMPGVFFLWLGIAAGVLGGVVLFFPDLRWEYQVILFASIAISSLLVWLRYGRRHPPASDQPLLNQRGQQYIGRIATLEEGMINRQGKLRLGDSVWKAEGDGDYPAGSRVEVVAVDGVIMRVRLLESPAERTQHG